MGGWDRSRHRPGRASAQKRRGRRSEPRHGPLYGRRAGHGSLPAADDAVLQRGVPWQEEHSVGIRKNGDDDNGGGIADRLESTAVANENDLIQVQLKNVAGGAAGLQYTLSRSNENTKVWTTSDKTGPILNNNNSATVGLGSYWVEWVDFVNPPVTDLSFQVRDARNGNVAFTDEVTFRPFTSVVIVIGGNLQAPTDPAGTSEGIFQVAIDEYRNGYDVHMYDHWDADGAKSPNAFAYDEIVKAVNQRGVTQVAIMGYSWGGGATFNVASMLSSSDDITMPYTVAFTSYIDGIIHEPALSWNAEARRPPLSLFHVGQYQLNGTFLPNGAASGGNVDWDRSYRGVSHVTIDDDLIVHELIKFWLEDKVSR